jgi:octanoyl-[GcvH]:protein N-octanoyltransferase
VWTPPPAVSFGRLDLLSERIGRAAERARAEGLTPVRRLAGGRAAAIGPGTVCLGWATPAGPMAGTQERYEMLAGLLIETLGRVGVDARVGELPGEWCAGSWSVLVGEHKVAGLAQRVIRGGAWAEAVVIVDGADALRSSLDHVQRALGAAWRPDTLAAVEGVSVERMRDALADAGGERWEPTTSPVTQELWERARTLREEHTL